MVYLKSEQIKQDYRDWYLDDETYLKELYKANYWIRDKKRGDLI